MAKLTLRPQGAHPFSPSCTLTVKSDWLQERLEQAERNRLDQSNRASVAIIVAKKELKDQLVTGLVLLETHEKKLHFDVADIDGSEHQFSVGVLGTLTKTADGAVCNIGHGSVRLLLEKGFTASFFQPDDPFESWHNTLWQEKGVFGLTFGANGFELDVLREGEWSRVQLIFAKNKQELWQLSGCHKEARYQTPDQVLKRYREKLANRIHLRLVETRENTHQAGVFFDRYDRKLDTILRPDFAIEFLRGDRRYLWLPQTLRDHGNEKWELLDADDISVLKEGRRTPEPSNPVLTLSWQEGGRAAATSTAVYPDLECVGATGTLYGDILWHFGHVDPATPGPGVPPAMPCWTRFHLPDAPPAIETRIDESLPLELQPGGWCFHVQPQDQRVTGPTLRLFLSLGEMSIEVYKGEIAASSPAIQAYNEKLTAPAQPPNVRLLKPKLAERRLLFGTRPVPPLSDFDPTTPRLLLPKKAGLQLKCEGGAVVTFAPYLRAAGIDFVSAGAHNIAQSVDPQSWRPVVDRDTTHTLSPFEVTTCQLTDKGLVAANYAKAHGNIAAAMALAPWVAMSDALNGTSIHRQLFHRNLVLEHGEFASASMDRTSDDSPKAIAQSVNDFIGAVRDDFTLAVRNLSSKVEEAGEIIHWLPAAMIADAPNAWIEYRDANPDFKKRAPIIRTKELDQQLTIGEAKVEIGKRQDWLTCDVKFSANSKATESPQLRIQRVTSQEDASPSSNGAVRARNSSVPLLFDSVAFTACAVGSNKLANWAVVADEGGQVHILEDNLANPKVTTLQSDASAADFGIVLALGTGSSEEGVWVIAVYTNGPILLWVGGEWSKPKAKWETEKLAAASITTSATSAAIAVRTIRQKAKLLIWTVTNDTPQVKDTSIPVASDAKVFLHEDLVLFAAISNGKPSLWQGNSTGDLKPLNITDIDSGSHVCLNLLNNEPHLAVLDTTKKTWHVALLSGDKIERILSREFSEQEEITEIALVNRPQGIHGLPPGCRPGYLCISYVSGAVDLWLLTDENYHCINPTQAPLFKAQQPWLRLHAHDGTLTGLVPSSPGTPGARAQLATCGSDGAFRIWDLDAGKLATEFHLWNWMLDNLGTRRGRCPVTEKMDDDVWVTRISRPDDLAASRTGENRANFGETILISRTEKGGKALVKEDPKATGLFTEIRFACEHLQLRKVKDAWRPEHLTESPAALGPWVDNIPSFFTSRGPFGKYGFYSLPLESEHQTIDPTAFLPRVAGVPIFVTDIIDITFEEPNNQSWIIKTLTLRAALINPLYMDGATFVHSDLAQGCLPAPIAQAIAEQSLVTISFERINSGLTVKDVKSDLLKWNMRLADSATATQSGFDGALELLAFKVSFDKECYRLALNVDSMESRARLLGGLQPLAPRPIKLFGFGNKPGEGLERPSCYGFETPWLPDADMLPIVVKAPEIRFKHMPTRAIHIAHAYESGLTDVVTVHEQTSGIWPVNHWDGELGVRLNELKWEKKIDQAAVGRLPVPTLVVADNDGALLGFELPEAMPRQPLFRHADQRFKITSVCVVAGRVSSWLASGNEAGQVTIASPGASRVPSRQVAVGLKPILALAGASHRGGTHLAAASGSMLALISLPSGAIEQAWDLGGPIYSLDVRTFGDELFLAAAVEFSNSAGFYFWKLGEKPLLGTTGGVVKPSSLSIGLDGDKKTVLYYVAESVSGLVDIQVAEPTGKSSTSVKGVQSVSQGSKVRFIKLKDVEHYLVVAEPSKPLLRYRRELTAMPSEWTKLPEGTMCPKAFELNVIQVQRKKTDATMTPVAIMVSTVESNEGIQIVDLSDPTATPKFIERNGSQPVGVGMVWKPHVALASNKQVALVDLQTGSEVRMLSVADPVEQLEFTENETGAWLAVRHGKSVTSYCLVDGKKEPEVRTGVKSLSVAHGFGVAAREPRGILVWKFGQGAEDGEQSLFKGKAFKSAHLAKRPDKDLLDLLLLLTDSKAELQSLNLTPKGVGELIGKPIDISFTTQVEPLDLVYIGQHLHLLSKLEGLIAPELWALPSTNGRAAKRWLFSVGASRARAVVTAAGVRLLALTTDQLLSFAPEDWLRFDDKGMVATELQVDLKLQEKELGFELRGRLREDGSLGLSKKEGQHESPVLAGLQRGGLFSCLIDVHAPPGLWADGSITFWREADDQLAGVVVRLSQLSMNARNPSRPGVALQPQLALNCQETRTFGRSPSRRWVTASGSLALDDKVTIYLADQTLVASTDGSPVLVTGFLDFSVNNRRIQGPLRLQCRAKDGVVKDLEFELATGVYRAVPIVTPKNSDSIEVDGLLPHKKGLKKLNLTLAQATLEALEPCYVQVDAKDSLKFMALDASRVPINLCIDRDVPIAASLLPAVVPQTGHLRGFGRRLRFAESPSPLFGNESSGEEIKESNGFLWLLQPVLIENGGPRIHDAGVVMQPAGQNRSFVTENVLGLTRVTEVFDELASVADANDSDEKWKSPCVCLAAATELQVREDLLIAARQTSSVSAARILLLTRQVGDQAPRMTLMQVDGTLPVPPMENQADSMNHQHAAMSPLVLNAVEAQNWSHYPFADRQLLPDRSDAQRDNSLMAWREFVVGRVSDKVDEVKKDLTLHRCILANEATAFSAMPRQRYLPPPHSLYPCDQPMEPALDVAKSSAELTALKSFHPGTLRVRLAPDKPGAMIHHHLQWVAAAEVPAVPLAGVAEEPAAGTVEIGKEPLRLGMPVQFALREPMQLNLGRGSGLNLVEAKYTTHQNFGNVATIDFNWKETLGEIPIRVKGEQMRIRQVPEQARVGAAPEEVRLEILAESQHCLQWIVQINDQLLDIDHETPTFPVYDSRHVASTDQRLAEPRGSYFLWDQSSHLALVTGNKDFLVGRSDSKVKVWSLGDPDNVVSELDQANLVAVPLTWGDLPSLLIGKEDKLEILSLHDLKTPSITSIAAPEDYSGCEALAASVVNQPDGTLKECVATIWKKKDGLLAAFIWSRKNADLSKNMHLNLGSGDWDNIAMVPCGVGRQELLIAAWKARSVTVWQTALNNENGQSPVKTEVPVSPSTSICLAEANGKPLLICTEGMLIRALYLDGTLFREINPGGPINSCHATAVNGQWLLAITLVDGGVMVWDIASGRRLRWRQSTEKAKHGTIANLAGRAVLLLQQDKITVHDLFLSSRVPPRVYLATSLENLEKDIDIQVKLKNDDEVVEKPVTLKPHLMLESPSDNSDTTLSAAFTSVSTKNGIALWELQHKTKDDALVWDHATTVRIAWKGTLSTGQVIEAVYGGPVGRKRIQPIPYSMTAAKCAAVLIVDAKQGEEVQQLQQRTLLFGDAASTARGHGMLKGEVGQQVFAFEMQDQESVDAALPTLTGCQLGVVLVKYFTDGQTLSDGVDCKEKALTSPNLEKTEERV